MTPHYGGVSHKPNASPWRTLATGLAALVLLALTQGPLRAAELREASVSRDGDAYEVRVEMLMPVATERVRRVLTDYRHIYRLSPSITETAVLGTADGGVVRVRTLVETCVSLYCVTAKRVEDVRELPSGDLHATIVPELSDFQSGTATWRIKPEGTGTRVTYQARMEPDFFVPPLVGSFFVKRNLHREIIATFTRLECIAGAQGPAPVVRLARTADGPKPPRVCSG